MKLQRTTLILLASAVILGGFVYYSEIQGAQKQEAPKTRKQPIFSFKEDQIKSLTIYTNKETLEFERFSGEDINWRMKTPKDASASNAAVAFLLDLLVEGKSDRSFSVPTNQRQEYGLDQPMATVKVQLTNQTTHRLILGKPDFNRSFIYALADPPLQTPNQLQVLLVPIDFDYAVNRPLSEWQSQQDFPVSPKPSPTTESPKPSPTANTPPKPSPTANTPPKPSPTANTPPKPSPTANTPKPLPTASSPKPSPTASTAKPSPTASTAKPSPTANTAKPSPTANTAKPSPTANAPKPSPTANAPKPSPTASTPNPSPTSE